MDVRKTLWHSSKDLKKKRLAVPGSNKRDRILLYETKEKVKFSLLVPENATRCNNANRSHDVYVSGLLVIE